MKLLTKYRGTSAHRSFQAKLSFQFTIAGFAFALIAAFAYAYMASISIKDLYKREGLQAAENMARLSELALLYESGDNAREAAMATLDFPSVTHVALINHQQRILLDEGYTSEKILSTLSRDVWDDHRAKFIADNKTIWQIAAPVFSIYQEAQDDELIADADRPADEYLGYVAIQIDTAELIAYQREIFGRNLLVGIAYGLAFVIVLNLALLRMMRPLKALTGVMAESTEGAYRKAQVDDADPSEIAQIAEIYNRMISTIAERDQRLRGQKDLLETEVALRTTELVQARDSALEANRHKSEFLANITHELRTPLQSILGYTEVVNELLDDEGVFECSDDMQKITRNAEHLLTLINSILDISKVEAGRMELNCTETNVCDLLQTAADTATPLVEKNNNHLTIELALPTHPLLIDEQKFFQIILNLLGNAAKFTENGQITLKSWVSGSMLHTSVIDTGIGIRREMQRRVFEPFRQLDGSETREFIGTGLGLSIAMKFAHIMGGDIDLVSETGKGSTFTLSLPLDSACEMPSDQRSA